MKKTMLIAALVAGMGVSIGAFAQVPASAPSGTTGLCKDGSFYSGASKKGACAGHKGVKTWYGASAAAAASAPAAAPAAAASAAAASGTAPAKSAAATTAAAAPGGGPGKVWVNDSTKVYHCPTDKYYGKTKHGSYMSEADAKAKGFHASHGKACS
ncbi:hypothetical protein GQ57_18535 [Burkholderia sp. MSh2]|uniref:DUF3761 domain-containing protein n=1 Tax=Burkholderia paludis TaxID=1506587 RepID=A0A6P2PW21_9BURK|nr:MULTISPECIES: DUF3761 domain-containing protein [Burkholderia]KEZ04388.1 hypothetical protein GQ57_18535 [Burkholderia sp. MSh2]CAB3748102.1 hypothetical protein LMG30113_00563 [Burkholderia paludis]VWC13132.1 hypothetical protein BPA30113_05321 [Burkholderia paludis]